MFLLIVRPLRAHRPRGKQTGGRSRPRQTGASEARSLQEGPSLTGVDVLGGLCSRGGSEQRERQSKAAVSSVVLGAGHPRPTSSVYQDRLESRVAFSDFDAFLFRARPGRRGSCDARGGREGGGEWVGGDSARASPTTALRGSGVTRVAPFETSTGGRSWPLHRLPSRTMPGGSHRLLRPTFLKTQRDTGIHDERGQK